MQKKWLFMLGAILIFSNGCVLGQRHALRQNSVGQGPILAASSCFQRLQTTEPYMGSPVYMVNGGPNIFSSGYGRPCLNAPGLLGDRVDPFDDQGPFARNMTARNARTNAIRNGAANRQRLFGNNRFGNDDGLFYPQYTPTRSPRDFLAPNPPTIGQ